ncbi:MAG: AsmA family protein [Salinivenus sp.]
MSDASAPAPDSSSDAADANPEAPRPLWTRLAIWGGGLLGGLLVLVLVAALVLPRLFTSEQLKGYVVPPLEEATGRTVEIDDIGLRVLWTPAVEVSGFRLANDERFEAQPAVTARTLRVQVALWPLLTGRIEPTAVGLDGLRVRYTVAEDGTTNFDTLGGPADTTAAEEEGPPLGGIPLSDVRISDAQLRYDDRSTGQAARLGFDAQLGAVPDGDALTSTGTVDLGTVRALLPDVREDTLTVQDATLAYDVRAAMADGRVDIQSLDLDTAPVSLTADGAVTALNTRPAVDLSIETGDTDLAALADFVPAAAVEGLNPRGTLQLNATVAGPLPDSTGSMDSLRVDGTGRLQGLGVDYQDGTLLRDLNADLSLSLDSAAVRNVEGTLLDASLAGHVALQDLLAETPALDLRLTTGALDLATLAAFAPEGEADAYNPQGTLRLDVAATGPVGGEDGLDGLTYDGSGKLAGAAVDYEGDPLLRDLGADLSFSEASVTVASIDGQLFEESLTGEVTVRDPMGSAQADGRLAGGADLARLAAVASDTSGVAGAATYDVQFQGPLTDPDAIQPRGTIELADLQYPYESFRAPIDVPEATVELTGTGLSMAPFTLRTGEQTMQLEASAQNLFPVSEGLAETDPALSATFSLTADRLDLVELYPEAEETDVFYSQLFAASLSGGQVEGQDPETAAQALYGGTEIPPYALDGRVEIDTFRNDPQRIDDLAFDVQADDRRLDLENLTGTTYEGALAGSVTLDQRGADASAEQAGESVLMASEGLALAPQAPATTLDYDVTLSGARAGAFLEDWTTIGRIVNGTLDLTIDGDTPLSEGFLPQLDAFSATGSSIVANGGLIAEAGLARALTDVLGLNLSSLTSFRRFGGPFSIQDGQIEMETWSINGDPLSGEIGGQLGLGGGVDLALTLNVPLSRLQDSKIPGLAGGGDGSLAGVVKKLTGAGAESETVRVRVTIGGTLRDPDVSVANRDGIQERLRALAKEEGLGRLRNLLPGGGN